MNIVDRWQGTNWEVFVEGSKRAMEFEVGCCDSSIPFFFCQEIVIQRGRLLHGRASLGLHPQRRLRNGGWRALVGVKIDANDCPLCP